jgi:hypothetical protein
MELAVTLLVRSLPLASGSSKGRWKMAVNRPVGDNARKGAVKKRTQRKTAVMGKPAWTKRDKTSGEFMAVKKSAKKFKGIRKEN